MWGVFFFWLFYLWFSEIWKWYANIQFLGSCFFNLSCLMSWDSWICGLMSELIWGNSQTSWFQVFLLFLSFPSGTHFHYEYVTHFVSVPRSLDNLFCLFFQSLFFSFWESYDTSSSSEEFFLNHVQSSNKPTKVSSLVIMCFITGTSSYFFLRIYISLFTLPIFSYMLSIHILFIL